MKKEFCLFFCSISLTMLAQPFMPSDKYASESAVKSYTKLQKISASGKSMLGHQDDLAYGCNWKYVDGRSDVKELTGSYPAVYGWDLGHIESGGAANIDSVPFENMKRYIKQAYSRGGIITISWHLHNPLTGEKAWVKDNVTDLAVREILKNGALHDTFVSWLNTVAGFLNSLRDHNNQLIPVIFRPFHENDGNWFWWGAKHCTPDEYKALFRFTVNFLRNEKGLHNLLFAYSPNTSVNYIERYPGDDYIDITGMDNYDYTRDKSFVTLLSQRITELVAFAKEHKKIAALTELGWDNETMKNPEWFTTQVLPALKNPDNKGIAWILFWRNGFGQTYYIPHKEAVTSKDFLKFISSGSIILENQLPEVLN